MPLNPSNEPFDKLFEMVLTGSGVLTNTFRSFNVRSTAVAVLMLLALVVLGLGICFQRRWKAATVFPFTIGIVAMTVFAVSAMRGDDFAFMARNFLDVPRDRDNHYPLHVHLLTAFLVIMASVGVGLLAHGLKIACDYLITGAAAVAATAIIMKMSEDHHWMSLLVFYLSMVASLLALIRYSRRVAFVARLVFNSLVGSMMVIVGACNLIILFQVIVDMIKGSEDVELLTVHWKLSLLALTFILFFAVLIYHLLMDVFGSQVTETVLNTLPPKVVEVLRLEDSVNGQTTMLTPNSPIGSVYDSKAELGSGGV